MLVAVAYGWVVLTSLQVITSEDPIWFTSEQELIGGAARCQLRVGQTSRWSLSIPIDTIGAIQSVEMVDASSDHNQPEERFYVGVEVRAGHGRFSRTRIVTLVPSYVLFNDTSRKLLIGQQGANHMGRLDSLPPGASEAFHWPVDRPDPMLVLRYIEDSNSRWLWCRGVEIDDVGTSYIKMYQDRNPTMSLIRVDVRLVGAARQVVLRDATESPPFRIENNTDLDIEYRQHKGAKAYLLPARTSDNYAWDALNEVIMSDTMALLSQPCWLLGHTCPGTKGSASSC
jgi:hypothetical protein